jgi:hypothetical protein
MENKIKMLILAIKNGVFGRMLYSYNIKNVNYIEKLELYDRLKVLSGTIFYVNLFTQINCLGLVIFEVSSFLNTINWVIQPIVN